MVAPLIAGAGRVIAAGTKAATRSSKLKNTRTSRSGGKTYRSRNEQTKRVRRNARNQLNRVLKNNLDSSETDNEGSGKSAKRVKKAIVLAVGYSSLIWFIPFYGIQVTFWFLGFVGVGLEAVPIANLLPWEVLLTLCYIITASIGVLSIFFALVRFHMAGIDYSSGNKELILWVCMAGTLVLFINIVPFAFIWVLWTMFSYKDPA